MGGGGPAYFCSCASAGFVVGAVLGTLAAAEVTWQCKSGLCAFPVAHPD